MTTNISPDHNPEHILDIVEDESGIEQRDLEQRDLELGLPSDRRDLGQSRNHEETKRIRPSYIQTSRRLNEIMDSSDEWTPEIEQLIKHWKDQTEKLAYIHQESGYINKTRYYRLSIPNIIIPFVMTFVSQNFYPNPEHEKNGTVVDTGSNPGNIANGVAFMLTSILSALQMFFKYNQLSEEHFQTSARYTEIGNRIDSELARKTKFRTPSDVFITELKGNIESLGNNSPDLPGNWC